MQTHELKKKTVSAMMWTALKKYTTMFIGFITGIILARLLTPHDYGTIGMLGIFMSIANTFIDAGFGSALIQKKKPTQTDYSTIFFWNLGMSVILYVILFYSAPYIARFYNLPILCDVLRVQAIVLIINAFNIIQRNQLTKKLEFKIQSKVSIYSSIISLTVTIIMAYKGFGVWSLVTQNILLAGIPAIIFWFYLKWRPAFVFSWKSFRQLFNFGFFMLMSKLVNSIGNNLEGLLIGRFFNSSTLGYYSKARSTEVLASYCISDVVHAVTYPVYAEVQDNKKLLSDIIKRLTMSVAFITFPILFLLILIAKPIFLVIYSERWLPSVFYFQVLCLVGIIRCMYPISHHSILAIGKSKLKFWWTLIGQCLTMLLLFIGIVTKGIIGLIIGLVVANIINYFINIVLVSKYIGYKWTEHIKNLSPITIVSVLAFLAGYFSTYFTQLNLFIEAGIETAVFLTFIAGWIYFFKPKSFYLVMDIVPEKFKFWKKRTV